MKDWSLTGFIITLIAGIAVLTLVLANIHITPVFSQDVVSGAAMYGTDANGVSNIPTQVSILSMLGHWIGSLFTGIFHP